jgi:glycerophosphoryl diester phosphodiesterase
MSRKIIVAHRGFANCCRENTLESCRQAIAAGVDMIELDIRKTLDNVFILFHDELINNQSVNQLSYAHINQLACDLGFTVPTLEEVLLLIKTRFEETLPFYDGASFDCVKLDLELKEEGYENEVVLLILKYLSPEEFIITSFNDESLGKIKNNYPALKTGLILGKKISTNILESILIKISEFFPSNRYSRINADFLIAQVSLLNFGFLSRAKKNNKSVFVWTINTRSRLEKLLKDERVEGIITDRSDLAVLLRNKLVT